MYTNRQRVLRGNSLSPHPDPSRSRSFPSVSSCNRKSVRRVARCTERWCIHWRTARSSRKENYDVGLGFIQWWVEGFRMKEAGQWSFFVWRGLWSPKTSLNERDMGNRLRIWNWEKRNCAFSEYYHNRKPRLRPRAMVTNIQTSDQVSVEVIYTLAFSRMEGLSLVFRWRQSFLTAANDFNGTIKITTTGHKSSVMKA